MQGDLAAFLLQKLAEQRASIPEDVEVPAIITRWNYQNEGVGFVIVVAENHARAVIELARRIFGDPLPKDPDSEYVGQTYFTRKSEGIVVRVNEMDPAMDILCLGLKRNRAEFVDIASRGIRAAQLRVVSEEFDTPLPPGSTGL